MPANSNGLCCPFCGSNRLRAWELWQPIPDYYGEAPFRDAVHCVSVSIADDPPPVVLPIIAGDPSSVVLTSITGDAPSVV
jgi:hypothetical protein